MSSRRNPRPFAATAAVVSLVFVAASCDDGGDAAPDPVDTTAPAPETTAGGGGSTVEEPAMEAAEVDMVDISFDPSEITVPVGATVVWTNLDEVDHTTTAVDGTWDSGVVAPGESFEVAFDEPGTYPYLCEIHATVMEGIVTVEG